MTRPAHRALGTGTHIGYAIGSVGTGIFSTVAGLLLLTFMVRQLQVPPALAGIAILVPRLWDILTDPLAGSLSDRTRTRWGARRPWLLAGALTLPIAFMLLFRVPEASGTAAAGHVLVMYILGTTAFTIFQVPYVAMPAEMTDSYHERITILSWRVAFLTIGILFAGAAAPLVIDAGGGGRSGYALMGMVIGALLFVALFGAFIGTRKVPIVNPVPSTASFREQLRAAGANRPFFYLLAAFALQALGIGMLLAGIDFFAVYILGDGKQTAVLFALLVAPALVTLPFWTWIGKRFGKRAGFMACTILFGAGSVSLLTAVPGRLWLVYLQVLLMGSAYAGTQMFPLAMLPDTIAADTAHTGLRRAGAYTGVWTAAEKAGMAVGPAVLAAILALTGFIETESGLVVAQPAMALYGIRLGVGLIPALLMAASVLPLRYYQLNAAAVAALQPTTKPRTGDPDVVATDRTDA